LKVNGRGKNETKQKIKIYKYIYLKNNNGFLSSVGISVSWF
jgi:hypothetical protein